MYIYFQLIYARPLRTYIILITRVSMRYGEIFHELKVSKMSRNISCISSVISDLSYTNGKCMRTVEH